MKNIFRFVLTGLLLNVVSLFASAADDCVAGDAEAVFSSKTSGLKDYKIKKDKGRHNIIETFKLPDGTEVKIEQGGCAHFDQSVSFTVPKLEHKAKNFDSKTWLARAKELLSKLPTPNSIAHPLKSELSAQEKNLLKQKLPTDGASLVLESTDEYGSTVNLDVTEKGSNLLITIEVNTAI